MLYAQVIVKQRTHVEELTYALSAQIIPYIKVGSLVEVPLRRRSVAGVVVGFRRQIAGELKGKIRIIERLAKDEGVFSSAQIEVIKQLSHYYGAPLAEVAFHALSMPPLLPTPTNTNRSTPLVLAGAWPQRREAYRKIIDRAHRRVLLIFASRSIALGFYQHLPQALQKVTLNCAELSQKEIAKRAKNTEIKAIIGTLGDVFFPLQPGDTMIIDQPAHIGNKSQARPFMTAKRIALARGDVEKLRIILGDSIVAPEDLLATKNKFYGLLPAKYLQRPITVIDSRGQKESISPGILPDLEETIKVGGQALVLVLARGWASALACRDCGHIFNCSKCHRTVGVVSQKLRCLYCANEGDLPTVCSECHSTNLKSIGLGVTAVKKYLTDYFKTFSISELSSDQPDITNSTQIIVATEKVFSLPELKFDRAFIVSADRLLTGVHLDGSWRLLGYLLELQSRAGQLTAQTLFPDSPVWSACATGNLKHFFAAELTNRKRLKLPPYGAIISIRGSAATTDRLFAQAEEITSKLLEIIPSADISYPAVDDKSGGNYQGHFTIYLTQAPLQSLKLKLAAMLPPAWHLDIY